MKKVMSSEIQEWNNFKHPESGMDRYGEQRLKLAVLLRDKVLPQSIPWIIENGNLLGAYRTGKFITHDDDFDIGVFFEDDAKSQLIQLLEIIQASLPPPYEARMVSTYAHKIEVFDPTYGTYFLNGTGYNGADYHHVTADIQAYQREEGNRYRSLYYINPQDIVLDADHLFPLRTIVLEGEEFQAPNNVEGILKSVYGSISPKAKYNKTTGKYEDQ